ncbi:MAG: hypothetical protein FWH57_02510 [Oscillospiraceae bacterium]|nr:hypothetical protein [Oscillospiraceae bacterium]
MTGDINYFRKRFFGGFNRKDVIDCLSKLAKERNDMEAARDKAAQDARALAASIAKLNAEIEDIRQQAEKDRVFKAAVFETAGDTFMEFETVFRRLRGEIEEAAVALRGELENMGNAAAKMPEALAQAGSRLEMLKTAFDGGPIEENAPAAYDTGA